MKKILNWVLLIVVIILLLVASYYLLAFAVWAANVVPN